MTTKCIILDPCADKRWDAFIGSHQYSTIFHHSLWAELVWWSYGYRPVYIALEDDNGAIIGGIPLCLVKSFITGARLVSVPFADWSDFLTIRPDDEKELLEGVFECSRKFNVPHVEIRTMQSSTFLDASSYSKKTSCKNHFLVLDADLQTLRKKIHTNTRRNIEKAEKSNLQIYTATSEKDMKRFYDIYVQMRKFHGLVPQPYCFFSNMWKAFYPANMMTLLLALDKSTPVAGALLLKYKDTMYYQYGGTLNDHFSKRPSFLLLWKGIESAVKEGFGFFDFGRTKSDNEGLMTFKKRWGTVEQDIRTFSFGTKVDNRLLVNRTNGMSSIVHSVCKASPDFLVKCVGSAIYRHLG